MLQRKAFLCFLALIFFTATGAAGFILTQRMAAQDEARSRSAARFVTHAILLHLSRLTPSLDAFGRDSHLRRDILNSLGKPDSPLALKTLRTIEDFARQHGLELFSLFLKPPHQTSFVSYATLLPADERILAYARGKYGTETFSLTARALRSRPLHENLRPARVRFPHHFLGSDRKVSLIRVDDRLYLDINYPLPVSEEQAVLRLTQSLPASFLTRMEQETGQRISFYDANNRYLAGILEPDVHVPASGPFTNRGLDGVDYIHYASRVMIEGSELAKVVVSFEDQSLSAKLIIVILGTGLLTATACGLTLHRIIRS